MESLEDLPDSVFGSASATQGGSEAAKKVPLDLVESEDSPFSEFKISSLAPLLEKQKHVCWRYIHWTPLPSQPILAILVL